MERIEYASGVEDVECGGVYDGAVDYCPVSVTIDSDRSGRMAQVLIPNGGLAQMGAAQLREFIESLQGALDLVTDDDKWR